MKLITIEHFNPLLGEQLQVSGNDQSFVATLKSIKELNPYPGQERMPFSMILESDSHENAGQGTYQVEHEKLEDLVLFMVPIGPGEQGICYEVVFN